jgi:RNA polymerase sigma-70 factor (ECF subfamily)
MSRLPDGLREVFPATHWSLVDRARQSDEVARREALAHFLQQYLPALKMHLTAGKRLSVERAEDLLQGFVADKIIEQSILDHARRGQGKFRSFLLATLNHYIISQYRIESAAKRQPAQGLTELHANETQMSGGDDPADQFNIAWARELVAEAIQRMKAECFRSNRRDLWSIFEARLLKPAFDGHPPTDYAVLVEELSLATPLDACRLLTTAKRMFSRNLHAVASEYAVPEEGGSDAEIEDLRKTLTKIGAQISRRMRCS